MRSRYLGLFAAIFAACFSVSPSIAVPFAGTGGFTQSTTVIDFEGFALGTQTPTTADVTIHAEFDGFPYPEFVPGNVVVRPEGFTQHAGIFEGQYYGHDTVNFVIEFNGLVQEFGVGIFDPNFAGNALVAYDIFGNELERVTTGVDAEFQTGPIGATFSTFVGFTRDTADIKSVRLLRAEGDLLGIDNVTYSALIPATVNDNVPEPGTGLVFLGSLLGLSLLRRKACL